ncbi:hypothetical protein FBU30_006755 [Linnemannia zychae]|nr:hypothetical protein FBU30_006755 [Linnemannia zychae]
MVIALTSSSSSARPALPTTPRSSPVSFKYHRVVRVNIRSESDLSILSANERALEFDYFTHSKEIGGSIDLRIPGQCFKYFQDLHLNYTVVVNNLQDMIDEEAMANQEYMANVWGAAVRHVKNAIQIESQGGRGNRIMDEDQHIFGSPLADSVWFKGYHSYADHVKWLNAQIAGSKGRAKGFSAGKSFEGRPQAGIRFGTGSKHVVFHGTQHAREWITTMTVEYIITQLLNSKDKKVAGYLKKYTFHIIPIMNPDGFVISQTTDRMHRKNAQPNGGCIGTDINRNWDSHFAQGGSSDDPCADDYRGPRPFSTPEAANIARYLRSLPNVAAYLDIHSFSQLWMVPFGYSSTRPGTYAYMDGLAAKAVSALAKVHGTKFQHGDIFHTIYQSSGTSVDYVYEVVKAKVAMAVELRDTGRHGFMLPANQILPTGEETWAALAAILDNMK